MECNRDEAIRAKEIAEKKMQNHDFEGARKIANKARQLFPELENISQLLAVCDVHCSAQSNIYGVEKDLYGILQVERLADEATIRKQFRKLALVLHPDKNKFPGAEAAFKLIGEANMVLSDKGKRCLHDIKCREAVRTTVLKPPRHQGNQNPHIRTQCGAQNKIPNASYQFSGVNHHQSTQSDLPNGQQTFWTCCPFCNIKYQYYRNFVNIALRCQSCSKPFTAYDIGAQGALPGSHSGHAGTQGVNLGSNRGQPAFCQQNEFPKQGIFKKGAQSTGGFLSQFGSQTNSSTGVRSNPWTRTEGTEFGRDSKTQAKENGHMNTEDGKEGVAMPKSNVAKPRESGTARNTNRKRGRNLVVNSSESRGAASSTDTEAVFEGSGGYANAGQESVVDNICHPRRSSRQKQQVSYSDNDDILGPPKRSRVCHLSSDGEEEQKEEAPGLEDYKVGKSTNFPAAADADKELSEQKTRAHDEGRSLAYGDSEAGNHKVKGEEAVTMNNHSESDSDSGCNKDPEFYECLDPEFSDFDKDKEEHCFAIDQIWACYDAIDGMPRFYAQIRRVFSPGFTLRITWLEADPEDQQEVDWADEGLPVSCGKFKRGKSDEISDRLMFSHQMFSEKGSGRCSYVIYPKKGEIWALFKDWDITWCSDPQNHRKYKFEIVEVLSDFSNDKGMSVAFLKKVEGYVSLFQKINPPGFAGRVIPSRELFRFSHRIPSFKMTGTEREGVPAGSYELDPASLPNDLDELYYPNVVKMEPGSIRSNVTDSCLLSYEEKVKSRTGLEKTGTPKKGVNFEGKNDLDRETLMLRRSPRELKGRDKNHNQVHASPSSMQKGVLKPLNGVQEKTSAATPSKGNTPSCQADDEVYEPMNTIPNNGTKSPRISSFSSGVKKSEEVFHDFKGDKLEWSFQVGQIWAFCRSKDGIHQCYAQIKKIKSSPLRLHVGLLESCIPLKDAFCPEACGLFKVSSGRTEIFAPDSFSHLVKAELNGMARFNIYPRVQEIWVLYSKQDANGTCSHVESGKYDIVEVLESTEHCIKVLSLLRLPGFKSVFRSLRRQRSTMRIMEIPRVELARFSHQIPAFQLTAEKDGQLRGCWELDPAAVPGNLPRSI